MSSAENKGNHDSQAERLVAYGVACGSLRAPVVHEVVKQGERGTEELLADVTGMARSFCARRSGQR